MNFKRFGTRREGFSPDRVSTVAPSCSIPRPPTAIRQRRARFHQGVSPAKDNHRHSPTRLRTGMLAPCSPPAKCVFRRHGHPANTDMRSLRGATAMVASIGKIASPSQGVSYFEKDGYYAKDDPTHREASAMGGEGRGGARALRAGGAGGVPDSPRRPGAGRAPDRAKDRDGNIQHRPGRDVTLSAPKSISLLAMVGGDERIVDVHDRAVGRTLAWVERNAIETRMQDKATGTMVGPATRRWSPPPSAMTPRAISTRSSTPIALSRTWSRAPMASGAPWCSAPGSLDTSLSHAAGLIEIAACHA